MHEVIFCFNKSALVLQVIGFDLTFPTLIIAVTLWCKYRATRFIHAQLISAKINHRIIE